MTDCCLLLIRFCICSSVKFPSITTQLQNESAKLLETDIFLFETYLNSIAKVYINKNVNSQHKLNLLDFFEDEVHSLSDKIRMLMLESSFKRSFSKIKSLENELNATRNDLYFTKHGLNETNSIVAMLQREVAKIKTTGPALRQPDPTTQSAFATPHSPLVTSAGLYYKQNLATSAVSKPDANAPGDLIEFDFDPNNLVAVAETILLEKGPLPVGEVGKMLQEATRHLQLSSVLKEKHNGLKKFLEKYNDKFIMSTDHPFNPHVYLRRCFSQEEQRLIENGCKAFLDEFKKTKVSVYWKICEISHSFQVTDTPAFLISIAIHIT